MRQICLLVLVVGLAACASSGNAGAGGPIVDMRGVDAQQYRLDLVECNGYADQVQVGQQAARGAAAGAVVAGAVGAIFDGGDGAGAPQLAAFGFVGQVRRKAAEQQSPPSASHLTLWLPR